MSSVPSDRLPFREAFRRSGLSGRTALAFSSWFGAGLFPRAPGTFGTLAALPAAFLMDAAGPLGGGFFILAFIGCAVWAAGITERVLGRKDPPEVVTDEVAGYMVTLYLLPLSWVYLTGAFFVFRILDIVKPFPVNRMERLSGGAGVVLDDVLAGVFANLILRLAGTVFGF